MKTTKLIEILENLKEDHANVSVYDGETDECHEIAGISVSDKTLTIDVRTTPSEETKPNIRIKALNTGIVTVIHDWTELKDRDGYTVLID